MTGEIAWEEIARQASRDRDYYRSLVVEIGAIFGVEAKTADDGGVHEDVLCAKVPGLVRAHVAALEEENTEWKRSSTEKNRSHEEIRDLLRNQLAAKDALVRRLENVVEAARLYVLARAIVDRGLDDDALSPDQIGEMTKDMNERLADLDTAVADYGNATR